MNRRWVAVHWGEPQGWELQEFAPALPERGEVTIRVHAAGMNPADAKHVATPRAGSTLPVAIGYEVSGELSAVGAGVTDFRVGDQVLAFRVRGGYATALTVPVSQVLDKPASLSHPQAANLLLAGTTAAEMLHVVRAQADEVILLHGASGAVGVSVLQQARELGISVIGTASRQRQDVVRHYGGIPVRYGRGLAERVRQRLADLGVSRPSAALDAAGTDEAISVSLELVSDRERIVTIVRPAQAATQGFTAIAGSQPKSAAFRDAARARLVALAGEGRLHVPIAGTHPLDHAREAMALVLAGHPGGKHALLP